MLLVLCWTIDLSFTSFGTSAQSEIFPFLEAVRNLFPMILVKYASVFLEGRSITHGLHYICFSERLLVMAVNHNAVGGLPGFL